MVKWTSSGLYYEILGGGRVLQLVCFLKHKIQPPHLPTPIIFMQSHFLRRSSSTLTSPATPWGLSHANTSIMWSAILISLCLEYSTTPFLRKFQNIDIYLELKKNDLYVSSNQKINDSLQYLCFFYLCSPPICHSDSDLSEGSRKYSPSSETSVETQRACGKRDIIIKHGNFHTCIHTHR